MTYRNVPTPTEISVRLRSIEKRISFLSTLTGRGWGSHTISHEVSQVKNSFAVFLNDDVKLCVDVGANQGDYTNELMRVFRNSEIHLFEPSSRNIDFLHTRFDMQDRVKINGCGLSDSERDTVLHSNFPGSGLASLTKRNLDHFNIRFDHSEKCRVIRFESYWKSELQEKRVDFAKLDVEGHELDVLIGFGKALQFTKLIQFEFGGCNIDTRTYFRDFWSFFSDQKFKVYRMTPFGLSLISRYQESDEIFSTTNFLAKNVLCDEDTSCL
jgi:FkbM family methyltransferase